MQAVVRYVRWPRGGASCCPVRAVAPRWCKLLSGTCAGPAVVQAVVRYVRWTRGGTSCYPVLTGGSTIVRARALRALVFPCRRWARGGASCSPMLAGGSTIFHMFYEVSALGELNYDSRCFRRPAPAKRCLKNNKNHSKRAPRRHENRNNTLPEGSVSPLGNL